MSRERAAIGVVVAEALWLALLMFAGAWLIAMTAWVLTFGASTCSTDGCDVVQTSPVSRPLGIPLSAWGAALSLATFWFGWRAWRAGRSPFLDARAAAGQVSAVAGVLAATAYSLFVLRAACVHCLVAAGCLTAAGFVYGLAALSGSPSLEQRFLRPRPFLFGASVLSVLAAGFPWTQAWIQASKVDTAVERLALPEAFGGDAIVWGLEGAPRQVLAFVDPLCPVCVEYLESQTKPVLAGRLRMRILAASVHGSSDGGAIMILEHRKGRFTRFVHDLARAQGYDGDVRPWIARRVEQLNRSELRSAREAARRQEALAKRIGIRRTPTVYLLDRDQRPRRIHAVLH